MDPPAGGGTVPGGCGGGGGGFLSNRRIKLTAVFPMIVGTRRTISKSDSSSLAKTGNSEKSVANAAATASPAADRPPVLLTRNRMRRGSSLTDLKRSDSLAGSTGSFGDLMNLKRFYDDSSVGSAENLVARAVPLSTVFCRQHHGAASEESMTTAAEIAASVPYHHRSRIDLQQKQQQQLQQAQHQQQLQLQHNHQQMQQQQTRRYASDLGGTRPVCKQPPQYRTAEMTSQQRIERMSRIMKQQNHRPEQMMRFRHTMTLVSPSHHDNNNIM